MDLIDLIFHEKQEGQLCAQHCLNSLLQANYFTAIDLASLAQSLDNEEKIALSDSHGATFNSENYDDSGFFSVQVIQKALQVWNLEIVPLASKNPIAVNAKLHPEEADAFILNLNQHWYTLRRFGSSPDRWYNLNSTSAEPSHISKTYLGMLLHQMETEGYSIFVVSGQLPISRADEMAFEIPIPPQGSLFRKSDTLNSSQDVDLQAALKASLEDEKNSSNAPANLSIEELRLKRLHRFGR